MNVRLLGLDGTSIRELTDAEIADLVGGVSGSKGELFHYSWHNGPRASIDSGCAACDGQVIQYANNPVVCQAVWDGKQNAVLDEHWAANKNCWSRGDGATWVRVPNLNMADGSEKPFYLRGGPASMAGKWEGDAIRNITGETPAALGNNGSAPYSASGAGNGATLLKIGPGSSLYTNVASSLSTYILGTTFDASRVVPVASENRVKTAYGVYTVRVFTEVSNTGAIDAAALATQLGVVDAKVQTLELKVGATILYPGGTSVSPASISINQTIEVTNPFPGKSVTCRAEVFYAGEWCTTGWMFSGMGHGVAASLRGSKIYVQSGGTSIAARRHYGGGSINLTTAELTAATPYRVVVTLDGGINA